jgi:hypothetical protein
MPRGARAAGMKKKSDAKPLPDELRPEYRFDYSKARSNPYARRLPETSVSVVLDPEIAAVFPTSESVNKALRGVIVRRRSPRIKATAVKRSIRK